MLDALVTEARLRFGLDPTAGLQVVAAERLIATPIEASRPVLIVPAAMLIAGGPAPARGASPVLCTLVLCDLVDSTALVERLGDQAGAALMRRHDRLARDLMHRHGGREIDKTDGFLVLFERPIQGVAFALDYQRELRELGKEQGFALRARAGIAYDRVLFFVAGGATWADEKITHFGSSTVSETRSGWTLGGGVDWAVTNNFIARVEYLYADLGGNKAYPFFGGSDTHIVSYNQQNTVRAAAIWKF